MKSFKACCWKIKHFFAVGIGFFRKPGRFSIVNYPRPKAVQRLENSRGGRVLDVGCGTRRLADHVIAIDLKPRAGVDLAADAAHLPFADQSCDGVWLEAVLEHVSDPGNILKEISRVLKPGAWLYIEVPFLQGEHAAPSDYQRWTRGGLTRILALGGWEIEWMHMSSGPFSALAYQLRSCLSMMTSLGSDFLYRITFEAFWGYVVWPIKFLDYLFQRHPYAAAHAFGYAVMVQRKP